MKSYKVSSQELRERAVAAVQRGEKRAAVAAMFGISVPTLDRWLRQQRTTGTLALQARGRPRPALTADLLKQLEAQLRARPDATLQQHRAKWEEASGHNLSRASLWRAFDGLGWSRKKRAWEPASATKPPGNCGET